ncbi:thioesterase II family protein [Streptomyces sp. NPDC017202]|uniref:thioesterase II family protein n=1 Tax=Streptomyces sp. NPDC017202 TaxID=3364981 RepID=UPI0037B67D61
MREWKGTVSGGGPTAPPTQYLTTTPVPEAPLRLFCFHHAGGSASAFTAVRNALAPRVDVLPVQLPGREGRLRESLPRSMADLVAELDEQLGPYLTGRYACYGHSMGALVAHDLVVRRQARGDVLPVRLVAGAARAPQLPPAFASSYADSDDELIAKIVGIGGMSAELLGYPDWVRPALELTRADLRLCSTRGFSATPPLDCPVDVFHAVADPVVSEKEAREWAARSRAASTFHSFEGGHFFFLRESPTLFAACLAGLLVPAGGLVPGH